MNLKIWLAETRAPFLLLSVALVLLGTSVAVYDGHFNFLYFILALIGLLLLHTSTNVLNDYFDYKSGIDMETRRTPFSGGSGILPAKLLESRSVYLFGIACLAAGLLIGAYLVTAVGTGLIPLIVVGAFAVYFYTPLLSRFLVGEIFAGLGLGALPVLGSYYVQTGLYTLPAVVASIPSFILTHNLLFLNEFPDAEVDKKAGRRHLVIFLGKRKAGIYYALLNVFMYLWIIGAVAWGFMPAYALIALFTVPICAKAVKGALKDYDSFEGLIPAQGANVITVLGVQFLLALGFFIAFLVK